MLWAHLEDVKGALGPFGAWWQPPEKIGGRNSATSPSGALIIKKNLCFRWRSGSIPGSSMLRMLRVLPRMLRVLWAHLEDVKGALGPFGGC